jgi:hypothetical protein
MATANADDSKSLLFKEPKHFLAGETRELSHGRVP